MHKFTIPTAAVILTVILSCAVGSSAQQSDPVRAAADAMGASNLKSLRFTGLGANFSVGQSANPGDPWPRVTIKSYDAAINYDTASMRVELAREQGSIPPRGGGLPFTGEQRFIEFVHGTDAWNVPLLPPPPPPPGVPGAPAPAAQPAAARPRFVEQAPQPQFDAAVERMQQVWLTPHGFLKAAMANTATTRPVAGGTEVSFTVGGKYRFTGVINRRNQVERVQTWVANPVIGDMNVEALYSDYEQLAGGVSFPMRIIQKQGGHPSLDLWIFSVQPNAAADVATPDSVRTAVPPPVRVEMQKIAEGVFYLTGGSHHSVAIEMSDYVVVVEAPLNEERSLAVIAKINETIPGKPIRVVVNTHHHFDHSGGLRTYADLGAAIVTHEVNRAYYEKAWTAPRTLSLDRLAQSRKTAVFQTFTDKYVLNDGVRTIEVHRIVNSPHADALAMVYLPAEKILIEADAYTPPPVASPAAQPGPATPAPVSAAPAVLPQEPPVNPATLNLYENIQRLKLDVKQIAALHGPRLATMDDLARASAR